MHPVNQQQFEPKYQEPYRYISLLRDCILLWTFTFQKSNCITRCLLSINTLFFFEGMFLISAVLIFPPLSANPAVFQHYQPLIVHVQLS
jgi:hypothetical protein